LVRLTHSLWQLKVAPLAPAECATTCLFAHLRPDGRLLFGGIGDGLVLIRDGAGQVRTTSEVLRDFSNETSALGISRSVTDWRFDEVPFAPGSIAVLATDGVSEDLIPERRADFAAFLVERLSPLKQSARTTALRKMLHEWPTSSHIDDLTLAVLWRPSP
jgi:serine phosphatase RsbU (regulator of sigma subunit)